MCRGRSNGWNSSSDKSMEGASAFLPEELTRVGVRDFDAGLRFTVLLLSNGSLVVLGRPGSSSDVMTVPAALSHVPPPQTAPKRPLTASSLDISWSNDSYVDAALGTSDPTSSSEEQAGRGVQARGTVASSSSDLAVNSWSLTHNAGLNVADGYKEEAQGVVGRGGMGNGSGREQLLVRSMAVGGRFIVALTEDGRVFSWGRHESGHRPHTLGSVRADEVAAFGDCAFALRRHGERERSRGARGSGDAAVAVAQAAVEAVTQT
jgi:hypothetical protein